MEPIRCPEKAVINYHHSLSNNPEGSSSHLLCGGGLKSPLNELLKSLITHKISTKIISVKNQNGLDATSTLSVRICYVTITCQTGLPMQRKHKY